MLNKAVSIVTSTLIGQKKHLIERMNNQSYMELYPDYLQLGGKCSVFRAMVWKKLVRVGMNYFFTITLSVKMSEIRGFFSLFWSKMSRFLSDAAQNGVVYRSFISRVCLDDVKYVLNILACVHGLYMSQL